MNAGDPSLVLAQLPERAGLIVGEPLHHLKVIGLAIDANMSQKYQDASRAVIIGSSAVFGFLAIVLIASRVAQVESLYLVCGSAAAMFSLAYKMDGVEAAGVSLLSISVFLGICLAWAFSTSSLFDPGFDSYAYHLKAIWDISKGWHPFFSPNENVLTDSVPNGHWTLEAHLVSITGQLLAGQALTIGLICVVAAVSLAFFFNFFSELALRYRLFTSALVSLLVVANPIVVTQLLTHYVDGPLYLYGCGLVFLMLLDAESPNRFALLGAAACTILMLNTKTSAFYYTPVIIAGGLISYVVMRSAPRLADCICWIRSKGLVVGSALLVGIVLIGFKPYVTNILNHGRLIYPPVANLMVDETPSDLEVFSSPVKFFYGLLARSQPWQPASEPFIVKVPGAIYPSELKVLAYDTRRGGFGPFFSLAFLTALASAVYMLRAIKKINRQMAGQVLAVASMGIVLLGASIIFPESWWARYIPFTWLAAILFVSGASNAISSSKRAVLAKFLVGVSLATLVSSALTGVVGAVRQDLAMHRTMATYLRSMHEFKSIKIASQDDPVAAKVWGILLNERGVKAEVVQKLEHCSPVGMLNGRVPWCGPRNDG